MTPDQARVWIAASNGRFFSATFTRRTTGERRRMVCRIGVTKYLRGGQLAFDPASKGLAIVFDVGKMAYRSIPLDIGTVLNMGDDLCVVASAQKEKAA